jgi:hypothetical protein
MDARTDERTENIYSIFRDKLLLLGEHVLAKVLYVFGLQPQIWSDKSDWSLELYTTFNYFNNKQHKHKEIAMKVLNTLFDKAKHNSYFNKIVFGSKQKIKHMKNPTLCLVILTWLRQLQQ